MRAYIRQIEFVEANVRDEEFEMEADREKFELKQRRLSREAYLELKQRELGYKIKYYTQDLKAAFKASKLLTPADLDAIHAFLKVSLPAEGPYSYFALTQYK